MNNPYIQHRDKFDIFLQWLRDLGGQYEYLRDYTPRNPKRDEYPPKYKQVLYALDAREYYEDIHGSIRKR